jgi:hypothetical protein
MKVRIVAVALLLISGGREAVALEFPLTPEQQRLIKPKVPELGQPTRKFGPPVAPSTTFEGRQPTATEPPAASNVIFLECIMQTGEIGSTGYITIDIGNNTIIEKSQYGIELSKFQNIQVTESLISYEQAVSENLKVYRRLDRYTGVLSVIQMAEGIDKGKEIAFPLGTGSAKCIPISRQRQF